MGRHNVARWNHTYSMTHNTFLIVFLFRQIFIVVLFTSKDLSATDFMVGKKPRQPEAKSYQTTEIKEAISIILTFSLHSDSCVRILLLVWEPDYPGLDVLSCLVLSAHLAPF